MTDQTQASTDDAEALTALVGAFEAYDQSTVTSREEAERDRDYRNGIQWTAEEVAKLNKRKQPVVTIDRIGPKIDSMVGLEAQHRTLPKAFPRTPHEEDGANAATDALRYVMEDQRWDRTRSGAWEDNIVEGACGVDIRVVEKYGEMCIEILPISWDRMWGDTHSRARNWNDGKVKGQVIWMDLQDAVERWPDKVDVLESTMASASTQSGNTYDDAPRTRWVDPKRKRVRIVEAWSKEANGQVWFSIYTKGGILERMESPYIDENGDPEDGVVFGSCFIDREGNRFGVVRRWISIQDEINKRRSKAMHLMNVRQTYGNQGAGDKNKLRAELAKPDGHVEMLGGAKFGEDFGILPTDQMAAAQLTLLQEAKSEIDAVGANAAVLGKDTRVQSGRALMQRTEAGMAELGPPLDAHKQFQLDVYRKVWNRIRQFWTAEKWIRVTDDEKNLRFVGLNQPMTLGEQLLEEMRKQGRPVTPEMEQQAKMDPAMQQVVGVKNKVAELDVDITIDDVPANPSIQSEQFEMLASIAPNAGAMPPALFETLIEASSLRNKDKLLARLKGEGEGQKPPAVQKLEQQVEQLSGALQNASAAAESKKAENAFKDRELALKERELRLREMEAEMRLLEARAKVNQVPPEVAALKAELTQKANDLQNEQQLLAKERQLLNSERENAVLKIKLAERDMSHAADEMTAAGAELAGAVAGAVEQIPPAQGMVEITST